MKKTPLILSILAIAISVVVLALTLTNPNKQKAVVTTPEGGAQAVAGDIVYIQMDTLVMQYDMYNDLRSAFESKAQSVQDDLQKKGRKLESDGKAFENQINKGLLTRSVAEQKQQELLARQQDLQNLAAQKQQELAEEEFVLTNRVMDAIKTFLEEYNKTHQYAAILTTSASTNVVIIGNPALDITKEVVDGLNAEYVKVRNN